MPHCPAVSVVLPVWNGERFLARAIESVLRQTLVSLELIVVDDGSTDRSRDIAFAYAASDPRVVVLPREHRGFSAALNAGIETARAPYVARMDCDDVALPHRLEKQVDYLEAHPHCVAVGSSVEVVDEAGAHVGWRTFPEEHDGIVAALLAGASPFSHPTIVVRGDALAVAGGYDGSFYPSEDLDLWMKLGQIGDLANLDEVLLQYRRHENAVSIRHRQEQLQMTGAIVGGARERRGLQPLRRRMLSAGRSHAARYHFDCARIALLAGSRRTALRHALATIACEPLWTQPYANLLACAVPQRVLRLAASIRGHLRIRAARYRESARLDAVPVIVGDE